MRETRIEKEIEIYATNLANKTKCISTNSQKKMEVLSLEKNREFKFWKHFTHLPLNQAIWLKL
jgi:hypothetical protein